MTAIRYESDVLVQTLDAFTVAYAETGLQVRGTEGSIVARRDDAGPGGRRREIGRASCRERV